MSVNCSKKLALTVELFKATLCEDQVGLKIAQKVFGASHHRIQLMSLYSLL